MFASEIVRFNGPELDSRQDCYEHDKINLHYKFDNNVFEICGQSRNLGFRKIEPSPSERKGSTSTPE